MPTVIAIPTSSSFAAPRTPRTPRVFQPPTTRSTLAARARIRRSAPRYTVVVEAKDGNNNTSTKTYAVTTTGTSTTYQYDAKGNLRYGKQPNGTVLREYQWDQQNRLVKALIGTHSDYEYDGADRRWRITERESGTQTKQETFVRCGGAIRQKRSGATIEGSYFGNGFQPGTTNFVTTRDHLGSVRDIVGSDGVTVASRLSYDPWGKVTETSSGALSDFTYTGHYYDRATGLNLALYRAYEGELGRWISAAPMGLRGGLNLYDYAYNDPLGAYDPDGLAVYHRGWNPLDGLAAWLAEASNWNLSQAQQRAEVGKYGSAAVYGFYGVSLALLEQFVLNLLDFVNLALGVEQPPGWSKAPAQTTPGTRIWEGAYLNDQGRSEPWVAHCDQYGRQVGRTDFNAGNKAQGIPDVHYHEYDWSNHSDSFNEVVSMLPVSISRNERTETDSLVRPWPRRATSIGARRGGSHALACVAIEDCASNRDQVSARAATTFPK